MDDLSHTESNQQYDNSWHPAGMLGDKTKPQHNDQRKHRWLNYYGPHGTIPGLSYREALNATNPAVRKFFHDRVVFVGSATQSGFSGKRRDQFRTPYSAWSDPLWPGVEFHATQFPNLIRCDWLVR